MGRRQEGSLDVAVALQFPGRLLDTAVRAFRASWPEVSVSLTELDARAQLERLHGGRLDVAVISHVGDITDGVAKPLLQTELGVLIDARAPWPRSLGSVSQTSTARHRCSAGVTRR